LPRLRPHALILLVVAGGALSAPVAASSAPAAHAAGSCGIGNGEGYGYSYLTSLSVSHTSCSVGRALARKHGRGWHCHRVLLDSSPVQYDARMTCTSRGRRVVWTYTQNK
jgi:hypothetical protein